MENSACQRWSAEKQFRLFLSFMKPRNRHNPSTSIPPIPEPFIHNPTAPITTPAAHSLGISHPKHPDNAIFQQRPTPLLVNCPIAARSRQIGLPRSHHDQPRLSPKSCHSLAVSFTLLSHSISSLQKRPESLDPFLSFSSLPVTWKQESGEGGQLHLT